MQSQLFSGVNIHIHISTYTQVSVYWSGEMTDTYTHPYPPSISRVQIHIHLGVLLLLALLESLPLHTQSSSCLLKIWLVMRHAYTHSYPHQIAFTNTHSSLPFVGASPLHVRGITHNLRAYFASVGRVFLVEMVILQTVQ